MIKNRLFFLLGILFILLSFILGFNRKILEYKDIKKQNSIIGNNYHKGYNDYSNDYLGYIDIERFSIKRLIKYGTNREVLDKNYVGMMNISSSLDSKYGNVILAGHNVNLVFRKLHDIKIGDEIKIITNNGVYLYQVYKKDTILIDDYSYFENYNDKKILTLVTCTEHNSKRLIVQAKLVNNG